MSHKLEQLIPIGKKYWYLETSRKSYKRLFNNRRFLYVKIFSPSTSKELVSNDFERRLLRLKNAVMGVRAECKEIFCSESESNNSPRMSAALGWLTDG